MRFRNTMVENWNDGMMGSPIFRYSTIPAFDSRVMSLRFVLALFLLAFAAGTAYAADKFRVAFPTLGPGSTPSWVTLEVGMWKKYDLDVELVLLSGGARMLPALVSGSVQLILGSDTGVTQANLQGVPITRLGVTMNSLGYSLIAPPNIRSVQDLKGKVLGISRGRDASYARLIKVLSDNGINPNTDVKFLAVGETPTGRLSALKAGLIQGTMFTPPLDLVASRDGLKTLTKVDVPTLGGGINTTPAFVQLNRKTLINFLKGYMEGIQYMATHKPESLKVFFKYFKNPDTAAMVYLYDETMPRIQKTLRPNPESVRYFLDQLAIDDPRVKQLGEKDHWNLSLLDEIQQSGFLERLYKQ
jgi:ABC-type nitrate/sulfonate/bicarbonate transport system substrate-binding protein